jgi:hypothetical protein
MGGWIGPGGVSCLMPGLVSAWKSPLFTLSDSDSGSTDASNQSHNSFNNDK